MDELQQLMALLGVQTFAEATAAVAQTNAFLDQIRPTVGAASAGPMATLDAVRTQCAFAQQVEAATGARGAEAMARIAAWQTTAARCEELEGQVAAAARAREDAQAQSAMDQAVRDGRLPPAALEQARTMYASYGTVGLNAYLAALPRGQAPGQAPAPTTPGEAPRQPAGGNGTPNDGADDITDEDRAVAKATGKDVATVAANRRKFASTKVVVSEDDLRTMNQRKAKSTAA